MKELDNDIKTGKFKKAYLLFGEERYLINQYKDKLRAAIVDESTELMNLNIYDGQSVNVNDIISAADTAPFFSDYRLLLISDTGLFKDGRKDDTTKLAEVIKESGEGIVFLFFNEKVDKRNALYKAVKKYGYCCELNGLKEREIISFITDYSKGRLKGSTAAYFVRNIGTSLENLTGEYNKLIAYVGDGEIKKEHIDTACSKSDEINIYDMVDAIGGKNTEKALDIYNNMLFAKNEPVAIMGMISRQFRLILKCKYLQMSKKYNYRQVAAELKMNEFVAMKCCSQSKNFKLSTIMSAIEDCAKCDSDFRKGLIDIKLGVELIIIKYSR